MFITMIVNLNDKQIIIAIICIVTLFYLSILLEALWTHYSLFEESAEIGSTVSLQAQLDQRGDQKFPIYLFVRSKVRPTNFYTNEIQYDRFQNISLQKRLKPGPKVQVIKCIYKYSWDAQDTFTQTSFKREADNFYSTLSKTKNSTNVNSFSTFMDGNSNPLFFYPSIASHRLHVAFFWVTVLLGIEFVFHVYFQHTVEKVEWTIHKKIRKTPNLDV